MYNERIAPSKKRFICFIIIATIIMLVGCLPMCFFGEELKGASLIYVIAWLVYVVAYIILMFVLFHVVRRKEILFFKHKYSVENMEKSINYDFDVEEELLCFKGEEFVLTDVGLQSLATEKTYPYKSYNIYAEYECFSADEIYIVFIVFENKEHRIIRKLDYRIYSLIKLYDIKVNNLDSVLNECENNLNKFFKIKPKKRILKRFKK